MKNKSLPEKLQQVKTVYSYIFILTKFFISRKKYQIAWTIRENIVGD